MITIDFFDFYGKFVVRHNIEMEPMHMYPFIWAHIYCKEIFAWYKSACYATITICGKRLKVNRYE